MIRKSIGDIKEEDIERIIKPFDDDYNEFLENYIMPEVIAYYIANSFYRNAMWESTFKQHYNSAADIINFFNEDYEKVKLQVIKLLKIKYALEIINENPLELVLVSTNTFFSNKKDYHSYWQSLTIYYNIIYSGKFYFLNVFLNSEIIFSSVFSTL